jgi:ABC-type methionine transport system permease subunit
MNFFVVLLVWLVLAAVLVTGVVLATKGSVWLLVVGFLSFLFAFAKWGCATH